MQCIRIVKIEKDPDNHLISLIKFLERSTCVFLAVGVWITRW